MTSHPILNGRPSNLAAYLAEIELCMELTPDAGRAMVLNFELAFFERARRDDPDDPFPRAVIDALEHDLAKTQSRLREAAAQRRRASWTVHRS